MRKDEIIRKLNKAYFSEKPDEFRVLSKLHIIISDGEIFIDIGASLGQYTKYINNLISNGHILAIEADPIRYAELEKNCLEWGKETQNKIEAINCAITDHQGKTTFNITNSNVSGGLFKHPTKHISHQDEKNIDWEEIKIDAYKLDKLIESKLSNKSPNLVKIDVEGAELRVIKGAINVLKTSETKFLVEIHSWGDPERTGSQSEIFTLFKSAGYSYIWFYGQNLFCKNPFVTHPLLYIQSALRTFVKKLL